MILQTETTGSLIVLLVSLILGTIAIYAGVRLIIDADTGIGRAAVIALLGVPAWAPVSFLWDEFLSWGRCSRWLRGSESSTGSTLGAGRLQPESALLRGWCRSPSSSFSAVPASSASRRLASQPN